MKNRNSRSLLIKLITQQSVIRASPAVVSMTFHPICALNVYKTPKLRFPLETECFKEFPFNSPFLPQFCRCASYVLRFELLLCSVAGAAAAVCSAAGDQGSSGGAAGRCADALLLATGAREGQPPSAAEDHGLGGGGRGLPVSAPASGTRSPADFFSARVQERDSERQRADELLEVNVALEADLRHCGDSPATVHPSFLQSEPDFEEELRELIGQWAGLSLPFTLDPLIN